jgi:alkylation response protein AidB-like acyl-CoA dehydrogenase
MTTDELILDLKAASLDIVPQLRERAAETEALRRLPQETVDELRELNFVGATVSPRFGGLGLAIDEVYRATATLATGCGSTAWVAGNCALHNFMIGYFPSEAQELVFGGGAPAPFVGNGFNTQRAKAEKVPGGYRVSGTWDFASGIMHSGWHTVNALTEQGPRLFLVPQSKYEVLDTWQTSGLRGTGSHDVTMTDVFVPLEHSVLLGEMLDGTAPGVAHQPSVFYHVPYAPIVSGAVVSTLVGLTRRILELFEARALTVVGGLSGVFGATRPDLQLRLAESAAELDATEALFWSCFEEMRELGTSDREITLDDRARWRRNFAYVGASCARISNRLYEASGAHTLFFDNPMNRAFRDVMAGSHHYGIASDAIYQAYAKVRFGVDPEYSLL